MFNATYDPQISPLTAQLSILVEVGQLIPDTFANVSTNHDPSSLRVQKTNRMKYDTKTKMVLYDLAHTR